MWIVQYHTGLKHLGMLQHNRSVAVAAEVYRPKGPWGLSASAVQKDAVLITARSAETYARQIGSSPQGSGWK